MTTKGDEKIVSILKRCQHIVNELALGNGLSYDKREMLRLSQEISALVDAYNIANREQWLSLLEGQEE